VDDARQVTVVRPPRLRPGDQVRLVSPASTPPREGVEALVRFFEEQGLRASVGRHALDEHGFLAGTDDDRLADLNDALADPAVRAVVATRGGKGAYRLADRLDVAAVRRDPKLLVGFSEITVLHLALWKATGVAGLHGAPAVAAWDGETAERAFLDAMRTDADVVLTSDHDAPTATLTTTGRVTGVLLGGNQDLVATAAGWALPSLRGAILLLEAVGLGLGHVDRQLTMLTRSGRLDGVVGVAVGQYTRCDPTPGDAGDWTVLDVLRERLHGLGVPVLGGLPVGHEDGALAVPVGTPATLDADAGTLTVTAAVR
jgi:muramoyltetrapeptide carboxypeptidase